MVTVTAYWRPSTMAEALELLERADAIVLAGGTRLEGDPSAEQVEVVDLQALHLDGIRPGAGDALRIGAMVTLQELADSELVPPVVREAARREQPSTLRAQGTVGGCIATGRADSELLAALLVHEAVVEVEDREVTEGIELERVLAELFLPAGQVVTAVTIRTAGDARAARTARTPADRAIVAAYARSTEEGRRVALTGVAPTPVLVEPGDDLQPSGDFRGSADYRRHLAEVLLARIAEGSE
ncbi:FAD binding domain-containing protein [Nocardioides taihuensis]|uniref:FAD binding domain-containing protein n=1 Tax=Nocardioides taihuensis TaxID=1835606 RepID=A0ABW0BE00_9ACTN